MIFCQEPDRPHKTYITIGQDEPGKVLSQKKLKIEHLKKKKILKKSDDFFTKLDFTNFWTFFDFF